MEKREQLYEGKAKKVFATEDPELYIVDYKDDATAFNGEKKGTIIGKGVINNRVTNHLMKLMEKEGIPTHYVEELSDRETLVKKVTIVPLEVIIRNIAAGSFSKRFGVPEGTVLKRPSLEYSYKDDSLGDPMINDSHILALGIADQGRLDTISKYAFQGQRGAQKVPAEPGHPSGGLQAGIRQAVRRDHRPRGRNLTRYLPVLGCPHP